MNGQYFVALAIAIAIAGAMLGGAGFFAGSSNSGGDNIVEEKVNEQATQQEPGIDGSVGSQSDGSIVGFVINSVSSVVSIIKIALTLPVWLKNNGFPTWFAAPVGLAIQLVLTVMVAQFASNRVLR